MKNIFELRMKDQIEERSSQLLRNLRSCEKKAWKKFRLERDSNPCVSYIYINLFILYGYITNSQYDQPPVGLIAQLVEHCTGIAEVMGSNPVQAWIFFRLSFRNFLSCVVTARIFLLFDLSSAVQIYVSYIYIHLTQFCLVLVKGLSIEKVWAKSNFELCPRFDDYIWCLGT